MYCYPYAVLYCTPGYTCCRHHSLTADRGHGITAILSIQGTSYLRNSKSVWLSCSSCQQAVKRHQHNWNRGCVTSSQLLATVVAFKGVAFVATVELRGSLHLLQRVTPAAGILCWDIGCILLWSKSWGILLPVTESLFSFGISGIWPHISALTDI